MRWIPSIFLSVWSCGSLELDAWCLLSRFDCSFGEGIVFVFVLIASCVSGVSVHVLFRFRMSLQSLKGLVLYVMVLSIFSMLPVVRFGYHSIFLRLMFVCG